MNYDDNVRVFSVNLSTVSTFILYLNYFSEETAADDFAFIQGNKENLGDP